MELIPKVLVCHIYDLFLDLCLLDHKDIFGGVLEELICSTELVNVGFKSEWDILPSGEIDRSFKIFCYDRNIVNGILVMQEMDDKWMIKHSWLYIYDNWMYTSRRGNL